jgi:hypothetical protein
MSSRQLGLSLKDIADELKTLSDTLSSQVRSIALGLIALVWAFLTGLKDTALAIDDGTRRDLLGVALVAVAALVLDYAQYVFGYWDSLRILRAAEEADETEAFYDRRDLRYRARSACFNLKQIVLLIGVAWMGLIIFRLLA